MDGTFQNTKLFKGEYNVRIDGPFIPLVRENTDGTLLHDGSVNTEISGTTKVKFEVQPFLNVEFVGDPQVSNGVIKAQVRVTRGVSDEVFREKIQPMGNWKDEYLNVTDIQFFVSYSNTVGYRARDERWSSSISYEGKSFEESDFCRYHPVSAGSQIQVLQRFDVPVGRSSILPHLKFRHARTDGRAPFGSAW